MAFTSAGVIVRFHFDLQRLVIYLVISVYQINKALAGFIRNVSDTVKNIGDKFIKVSVAATYQIKKYVFF